VKRNTMFDIEKAIADWHQRMLVAGIKSPVPLEELESHLRDEIEHISRTGLGEEKAFHAAIQQMGQAKALQGEFTKVGGAIRERLSQFFLNLAGIPNP
jgi:hypothetical protein